MASKKRRVRALIKSAEMFPVGERVSCPKINLGEKSRPRLSPPGSSFVVLATIAITVSFVLLQRYVSYNAKNTRRARNNAT